MGTAISLCMIVKNEEKWIARSIESARSLVSEIIVVDTGSTDRTPEIAKALGARVIPFDWIDDFSAARNRSIAEAKGQWILVLDADETLDSDGCREIRAWTENPSSDMATLIQTTYSKNPQLITWIPNRLSCPESKGYPGYIESHIVRLFQRDERIHFAGPLHEEIISKKIHRISPARLNVRLHHYGQVRGDRPLENQDKNELYLRIAQKKMQLNPEDPKAAYEYAVSSWENGKTGEAASGFQKALLLFPTHVPSLCALATLRVQEGNREEALALYRRALEVRPSHIGSLLGMSDLLVETDHVGEAMVLLQRAHELDAEHPQVLKKLGMLLFFTGDQQLSLGFLRKASKILPQDPVIHLNLGWILLHLKQGDEAVRSFGRGMALVSNREEVQKRIGEIYRLERLELPQDFNVEMQESL